MVEQLDQKILDNNDLLQNKIGQFKVTEKDLLRLRSQIESLQNKIDIASSIANYHDSCNYTRKISDLKQSIDQSRVKGEDLEKYLAEQNETWIKMFNQTKKEIMMKIDEINQ